MKVLKNESSNYMHQIVSAIHACYAETDAPSDRALMQLYVLIGEQICAQGEKAFVVHLAEALAIQFPQRKGFSPRNLRRMRDFYLLYENSPSLMAQAMELGWTQNTLILECCETNEQRSFYMRLAAAERLSKLALAKAIEENIFEAQSQDELATLFEPVNNFAAHEGMDTAMDIKPSVGASLPLCEPFRQGCDAPIPLRAVPPPYLRQFLVFAFVKSKLREIMSKTSASGTSPPSVTVFQCSLFMCQPGVTDMEICRRKSASNGSHLRLIHSLPSRSKISANHLRFTA